MICKVCEDTGFINYGLADGICGNCPARLCSDCGSILSPTSIRTSIFNCGRGTDWLCAKCMMFCDPDGVVTGEKVW